MNGSKSATAEGDTKNCSALSCLRRNTAAPGFTWASVSGSFARFSRCAATRSPWTIGVTVKVNQVMDGFLFPGDAGPAQGAQGNGTGPSPARELVQYSGARANASYSMRRCFIA